MRCYHSSIIIGTTDRLHFSSLNRNTTVTQKGNYDKINDVFHMICKVCLFVPKDTYIQKKKVILSINSNYQILSTKNGAYHAPSIFYNVNANRVNANRPLKPNCCPVLEYKKYPAPCKELPSRTLSGYTSNKLFAPTVHFKYLVNWYPKLSSVTTIPQQVCLSASTFVAPSTSPKYTLRRNTLNLSSV